MAPPLVRGRALLKQRLVGVLFLVVLAALVLATVAIYQKTFTPVVTVTLQADRIGNQLSKGGDVKARGLLVGEIRSVSSKGDGAEIELAINEDQAKLLPVDVTAQLLPKTLFGEKFVALDPHGSTARPLREGDVITQDRSETARETAKALDNLLPLLQTLKPQQVSITLNALSSALRGRGDQLGENLQVVDSYLQEFNPELERLERVNAGMADYADILQKSSPDLLRTLDNLSFLNRSLVDQEQELSTFLTSTTGFSAEMDSFLRENESRFITVAADSLPSLQAFARYSPQYPCLFNALTRQLEEGNRVFGGLQPGLHITLEVIHNNGGYNQEDKPAYGEDEGPTCFGLVGEPLVPFPVTTEVTDGYCDEYEEETPGVQTSCPGRGSSEPAPPAGLSQRAMEQALVGAAVAPVMGVPPDEVPDLATLLFGPVARGTTVALG